MRRFVLMDEEPGAAGGGDPAPAAPVAAPAADPAPSSLAPAPPPIAEAIPEKFRVMNGDALDVEASARKVVEAYAQAEKRIGSGDLPPKAPTDYTVTVPDQFKDSWQDDSPTAQAFRDKAHAAGYTQKQFEAALGMYFDIAPKLVEGAMLSSVEAVRSKLDEAWGDKYDASFNAAFKAFEAYADPADKGKFDSIMTDPALAYRLLAKIGPEIGEAGNIPRESSQAEAQSIRELLTSEAARNEKHPEHKATRAKIDAYYAKLPGAGEIIR